MYIEAKYIKTGWFVDIGSFETWLKENKNARILDIKFSQDFNRENEDSIDIIYFDFSE